MLNESARDIFKLVTREETIKNHTHLNDFREI
jgi:hypothetical protein